MTTPNEAQANIAAHPDFSNEEILLVCCLDCGEVFNSEDQQELGFCSIADCAGHYGCKNCRSERLHYDDSVD